MSRVYRKKSAIDDLEAYKIALETRNMEIKLFWQRSNYFLALNAALALGFFRLTEGYYGFALACFGLLVSFLWFQVNLGSKYWQSRWEERLKVQEKKAAPNLEFFAASKETIHKDVQDSLNGVFANDNWFKVWLNKQILTKPSVSDTMSKLSLTFVAGWFVLLVLHVCGK
ncbi:hypothetical protein CDB79_RS00565 [Vibrio parahaemolyticus]|uniref:RipA family octameric membrane protein n=1 Tax=Vibrio parahaemolyticus TaxID=670 RepID=UPI00046F6651|nr:hypothetical protein [Vibrio parahaemolyticus]EJG1707947.1 hypothetical protein [Vibrio parahaemolyticus]EJG1740457.1 hypothetical protein [Vibrio parahaemolyticus]EJG1780306.1 hypothetical protein [Vibrio parahaemolyticus]MDF4735478.1 hypothetical protein [Vibrio parahaemolyticus]MDG2608889.1 hypothetical protein [Vibrio parahaemolyticus]